jgi:hypothetical protein
MSVRSLLPAAAIAVAAACSSTPKETDYPGSGVGKIESRNELTGVRGYVTSEGKPLVMYLPGPVPALAVPIPMGRTEQARNYEVRAKDGTLHLVFSDEAFEAGECVAFHGFSDGPSRTQWSRGRVTVVRSKACDW